MLALHLLSHTPCSSDGGVSDLGFHPKSHSVLALGRPVIVNGVSVFRCSCSSFLLKCKLWTHAKAPPLGEVRTLLHNINLADCPDVLRQRLSRFDSNGNGFIDAHELPIPDKNDTISIRAFPAAVRSAMDVFDTVRLLSTPQG